MSWHHDSAIHKDYHASCSTTKSFLVITMEWSAFHTNKFRKKIHLRSRVSRNEKIIPVFLSGCCLGKSRAERPSVSKATMKRDTTAIISHFLATKKLNMRGPSAQSREDERARKQNGGRGSPGNTLDRR